MSDLEMARRQFLKAAGLGLLAFQVNGAEVLMTPKDARAKSVPLRVLTAEETATLEALGEALLPGAREAGIVHYLDQQLAADPAKSLLMIRYLDVPPPYLDFYRPCIAAAAAFAKTKFNKPLPELSAEQLKEFVGTIARENPADWRGPPSPFFYFVLRSDVVDVVYGTPEGFDKLGVPYMAHIMPTSNW